MSRITIWNVIGWVFLIFLGVSKEFFDEQFSVGTEHQVTPILKVLPVKNERGKEEWKGGWEGGRLTSS